MTRSTQLSDAALDAAASGLFVFPCVRRGKAPAICDWERRATRDPRQITNWWQQRPWSNIGAAVGRSGLLVIDLDIAHGELPPPEFAGAADGRAVLAMLAARAGQPPPWGTRTIETGSGGWHLYFRAPAGVVLGNTTGALGPFVDSRGRGGLVVAAGSVARRGRYRVINPAPVADLPEWLTTALSPPPPRSPMKSAIRALTPGRASAYLVAIIDRETSDLAGAAVGTRHRTRLAAARTLGRLVGGGELTEEDAFEALWQAASRHIGHDCTEREVIRDLRDGLIFGRRSPRAIGGIGHGQRDVEPGSWHGAPRRSEGANEE